MNDSNCTDTIFSIDELFSATPFGKSFFNNKIISAITGLFEHVSGLYHCKNKYKKIADELNARTFLQKILKELHIKPVYNHKDKFKIPLSGPCVVVSNHPFGLIDGIILTEILLSIRPDVKVMSNFLLNRIPNLNSLMISVDPFERESSVKSNVRPIREAIRFVKAGGLLLIFPAGEVSHLRLPAREITDPPWKSSVITIIRQAKSPIVPVFFSGKNSAFFQMAGLIHPSLRTLMLARELLKKQGKQIHLRIGNTISHRWISRYTDDKHLLSYLRWRTYLMGHHETQNRFPNLPAIVGGIAIKNCKCIVKPQAKEFCIRDIQNLPQEQKLAQNGHLCVYYAQAKQIPHVLPEIGRLREITFRQAGEGTGKAIDLDCFDNHYIHLFIWNSENKEITGAYRIGQTDLILAHMGNKGLYTNTLFEIQINFFNKLGPALELGRSFIRHEYQKTIFPLLLLWKGIAAFIVRNPRYRTLFGPVSISSDYNDLSRHLLATTLLKNNSARDLAVMIKPRTPIRYKRFKVRGCRHTFHDEPLQDLEEACSVISDIEINNKNIPILFKHYLNLGGQLLSFNIDKSFSGVMDGLIVIDLLKMNRKTMERYMSVNEAHDYLSYHSRNIEKNSQTFIQAVQ